VQWAGTAFQQRPGHGRADRPGHVVPAPTGAIEHAEADAIVLPGRGVFTQHLAHRRYVLGEPTQGGDVVAGPIGQLVNVEAEPGGDLPRVGAEGETTTHVSR
jgi:hypothetical protein